MEANAEKEILKVQFGEKTLNIDQDEAVRLLKTEEELNKLQGEILGLAKEENQSVFQFLEELKNEKQEKHKAGLIDACGGNEETARYIMSLEKGEEKGEYFGISELKEYYPEIEIGALPEVVKENSKKFNTSILDEYLRYKARNEIEQQIKKEQEEIDNISSVGSMRGANTNEMSPERYEFLKGLWG